MPTPPEEAPAGPRALVVMGVAGSGKTTAARLAADLLNWRFLDADDLHSSENRARIAAGDGLQEEHRRPWLITVARSIRASLDEGQSLVVACSSLRRDHRALLATAGPHVTFVWLDVPEPVLRERLSKRQHHFADESILASQLDTLEPPAGDEAHRVEGAAPLADVAAQVAAAGRA